MDGGGPFDVGGLLSSILGGKGGITHDDLDRMVSRHPLSQYLPWIGHNDASGEYLTLDNCVGRVYELVPVSFMGVASQNAINSLLQVHTPRNTIIQFILVADSAVDPLLDVYLANKKRQDPLVQKSAIEFAKFMRESNAGIERMANIPTRNFRLFCAIKSPEALDVDVVQTIETTLKDFMPRKVEPIDLIVFLRRIFNGFKQRPSANWTNKLPINKQIIDASSPIDMRGGKTCRLGEHYARVITAKSPEGRWNPLKTNQLFGGMMGVQDDSNQVPGPFIYSLNIINDPSVHNEIEVKSNVARNQAAAKFIPAIRLRAEEGDAMKEIGETGPIYRIIPSMLVLGDTPDRVRENSSRAMRLWERQGWSMQEESAILTIMLIVTMPLGLYLGNNTIKKLDRDFQLGVKAVSHLVPVQGDYRGCGQPVMLMVGRKGQLAPLDLFDRGANNHNFLTAAESGSGKSFLLNQLCMDYYGCGAAVRIIDIGGSYRKICKVVEGRYMDFGEERVVINPFTSRGKTEADKEKDQETTCIIVAEMVNSASRAPLSEDEWSLIKGAVRNAYKNGDVINGIDAVRDYLKKFPQGTDVEVNDIPALKETAQKMWFNLADFGSTGTYGRWFNGKSTFDISNDDFVVLELEQLRNNQELFGVIVMQVLNAITQDLYLSARDRARFILFEEVASFLKTTDDRDLSRLASIIEEGYRRARKYRGSFGVVLQSIMDLEGFGALGPVILQNAAFRFLLQGSNYETAMDKKLLNYGGFERDLLLSVKNNKPRYSEIFVHSPFGAGIGRLVVDPWTYWINTSAPEDVAQFEELVGSGMDPIDAISQLSGVPL